MKTLRIGCVFGGLLSLVLSVSAQTFTTLLSLDAADGAPPFAGLIQATDGNLYGTTGGNGANGGGTVFKITPSGTLTTLYNFTNCGGSCTDGYSPIAGLVQATNGNFYGTTLSGGVFLEGTVFEITPGGALTTLYSFCAQTNCTDGQAPSSALVQGTDGNFYGTTVGGGSGTPPVGTVFKITPSGSLTTLHSFDRTDGEQPYGTLIQATNGNFYGTTSIGGANGSGTVFKITSSGALTTLYNFCAQSSCADGGNSIAGLVQATDGNLYGETDGGGGDLFGTIFKITPTGTLTTLHSFDAIDGEVPRAGLVQGSDGNLYGTTSLGGFPNGGTVFKITRAGTLTSLYSFCSQTNCTDGQNPVASLVQDTNGVFYGTTELGGADAFGTVFSLSVGLGPFAETRPTSGKVGKVVKILGTNLTGSTSVTFNGTAATFTVVSGSEITTTVPTGATTGKVKVTTPQRTLTSNMFFRVIP
jgi:uncharacterized repeat protein (TIGR03803 family)